MRCVRVLLAKKGRAKYTSHLDMQRCMMRAVRRAGIDLWYTEGFNPHPYVTFALPLPLGVESEGEPVDIRLEGDMTNEQVRDSLNATMPEGIEVVSVDDAVHKPGDIAFARYHNLKTVYPYDALSLLPAISHVRRPYPQTIRTEAV